MKNCYTHHEREDLLPTFDENLDANVPSDDRFREGVFIDDQSRWFCYQIVNKRDLTSCTSAHSLISYSFVRGSDRHQHPLSPYSPTIVQTLTNPDGSVSLIQLDSAESPVMSGDDAVVDSVSSVPSNAQILNVSSIQQVIYRVL